MSSPLTIQPCNIDNYLALSAPNNNNGAATRVYVAAQSNTIARTLLKFDFSALPDGVTISAATLSLYQDSTSAEGKTFCAYELTQSGWTELKSTWNAAYDADLDGVEDSGDIFWATAGGDYTTNNGASQTVPAVNNWMVWDVLALVKHFQSAHGEVAHFLLRDETENQSENFEARFISANYTTNLTLRPKLVITYTIPVILTAEAGNYSQTGQAAGLKATRKIAAGAGSYSLTGQPADLKSGRKIAAGPGSYALTGQDVVLTFMGHNFESGTYLKFDAGFHLTKIYFPNGTLWGYAEFDDNVTRIYLSNGTPWGYLAFDEQTNATRIYLADETLWGYFKSSEASDVAKIYLADGTLWGEAGYNGELDQTDIYQY